MKRCFKPVVEVKVRADRAKRCFKPVVEVKVRRLKNGFALKFITLRLQVVKVVVILS